MSPLVHFRDLHSASQHPTRAHYVTERLSARLAAVPATSREFRHTSASMHPKRNVSKSDL